MPLTSTVTSRKGTDPTEAVTVLLSVYAGVAILLTLLALVYFPNKPSLPPSNSAAEDRMEFWQGFKTVIFSR